MRQIASPNRLASILRSPTNPSLKLHRSTQVGLAAMALCTLTATLISYRVPPFGFGCRSVAELVLALVWFLSAALNAVRVSSETWEFRFIFLKDFISLGLTMGGIIATQVGVMNRCSCYTFFGTAGLALPETELTSSFLFRSIALEYPLEAFACIALQLLVIPSIITWRYHKAIRVFLQRDDDKSNLYWRHAVQDFFSPLSRGSRGAQRQGRSSGALSGPRSPFHRFLRRVGRITSGLDYEGTAEQTPGAPLDDLPPEAVDRIEDEAEDTARQSSVSSAHGLLETRTPAPVQQWASSERPRIEGIAGSSSLEEPDALRVRSVRTF